MTDHPVPRMLEPPEPRCRPCAGTGVVYHTRRDTLVPCPACDGRSGGQGGPMYEAQTDGYSVRSLFAERVGGHVHLTVRTQSGFSRAGQSAGTLKFDIGQRDAFVWVACRLAGEDMVSEKTAPFTTQQIEELFA